ncbi:MAG: DUF58 domain-containing protein [Myxococcota bacterium]
MAEVVPDPKDGASAPPPEEAAPKAPPTAERPVNEVDPKVLAQISHLNLRARVVADSALAGMHRSPKHGSSVEFAEHKEYSPGDDVRHLDWRAAARFDRDFVKRFEDESSLRALLVVDTSGTMGYPSPPADRWSKLEYAKTAAGALAMVLARQGDAAGLASFAEKLFVSVPPRARRGHLQEILATLGTLTAEGPTRLTSALEALSAGLTKRSLVVLFSDLLDGGLGALPLLARLRARRHDVVLFHTLDLDELEFPFEESTLFTSLEDEQEIQVDAREIRTAYLEELTKFRSEAEASCQRARVDYFLAPTHESPGEVLARFLATRARMRSQVR